jgi:hypothetical protein
MGSWNTGLTRRLPKRIYGFVVETQREMVNVTLPYTSFSPRDHHSFSPQGFGLGQVV